MSGEALTSAQQRASAEPPGLPPLTAMGDCVLARALRVPARTPAQLRQLQFHCGKPPPAADPRTRILMRSDSAGGACAATATHAPRASRSAMGDIHRDFHAKAEVNRQRSFPLHDELL